MKKLIALMLAVVMLATLCCSCGTTPANTAKVKVIDIPLSEESYAFCVGQSDTELLGKVNEYLKKIKDDGTFDAICDK